MFSIAFTVDFLPRSLAEHCTKALAPVDKWAMGSLPASKEVVWTSSCDLEMWTTYVALIRGFEMGVRAGDRT